MIAPNILTPQNPWPGLQAYAEDDRQFFFGRDAEIDQLLWLVRRNILTVVFGPSGTGKTSLMQAGVFPKLRIDGWEPHWIRLDHGGIGGAYRERTALIGQVQSALNLTGETLWEGFHRLPRSPEQVVAFDQLEEIFTLGDALPESEEFLTQLADLVENYYPASIRDRLEQGETLDFEHDRQRYHIVLILREDFVWCLDKLRARMPSVMRSRFVIHPFTEDQALEAVEKPGREVIDSEAALHIVRFATSKRGPHLVDPAILSLLCRELNRDRRGESNISPGQLEGDSEDILSKFWEDSIAALDESHRLSVRTFIEDRLVSPNGFRTAAPCDEMALHSLAINALVDGRLLRIEERLGTPHLELAHDVLCPVVSKTRAERRQRAELVASEFETKRRANESRLELVQAQAKRTRVAAVLFLALTLSAGWGAILAVRAEKIAMHESRAARQDRDRAQNASRVAAEERARAELIIENIRKSSEIRNAALSHDEKKMTALLGSLKDSGIRFRASAKNLHYKNPSGKDIYNFELFPDGETLKKDDRAVAFITYFADHPTFRNTLMTTGSDRAYRASYIGWGCLEYVRTLIEYKDPMVPATVSDFNMCRALGW